MPSNTRFLGYGVVLGPYEMLLKFRVVQKKTTPNTGNRIIYEVSYERNISETIGTNPPALHSLSTLKWVSWAGPAGVQLLVGVIILMVVETYAPE